MEILVPTKGRKTLHRLRSCDCCHKAVHLKGTNCHVPNAGIWSFFQIGQEAAHYCTECAPDGNFNSPMFWKIEKRKKESI